MRAAHMDAINMGVSSSFASAGMEFGGMLAGGSVGAAVGNMLLPGLGGLVGSVVGAGIGQSIGGKAGGIFATRATEQMGVHNSLMSLSNPNSPYGSGVGYSTKDAKDLHRGMVDMATDDPYFGMGDIGRILDEGIKSGNIKGGGGGGGTGDIKNKLKGLK
jgi:hypothetical protein